MSTGSIHIQTLTGGSLPCAEVWITLTDTAGNVLAEFFTDENGDSTPVLVDAPPAELSLDENNQQLPYAVYELYARKESFEPVEISGIQVFAGQTSLLQLAMQPSGSDADPAALPQRYEIPRHHLTQADSCAPSVAPYDDCSAAQVLSQVVIPQYITVHLARPTASAQNVTVTFKDYIKNVACSEIYPTWPEQALRANIYCQISLALNRVYTEWYRSKGYSFQITNSTSYDQYYVHGRNLFENVSQLVDELFATYIRRSGTVNPYYAEYCDGKTVTCPGLKQWGTVTLANQGYSAIRILRSYYGSDVELVTSTNLASIPQSYPGSPLQVGSAGTNVRIIQRQLNRIAKNYPSFGTLTVDGVFGTDTQAVVRRFQKQFSLTQDGVVGYSTWYKISYIYVAVKRLAELTSEGEFPNQDSVSNAEGAWGGTVLFTGSQGSAVRQVQYWLNTVRGYINGLPLLAVDGIFGSATANAVRMFQAWAGLTADGVVGRATWNALYREFSSVMLEENTELSYVTQYPGTVLRQGSTGSAVRTVQFWLSVIAGRYSSLPAPTVDGIYGTGTAAAVRSFQQLFGLTADGAVGPLTWNKLRQIFAAVVLTLVPDNDLPGTYPGSALRRGSTGSAVREMQYYLYVLSLYYPTIPTIAYDGTFGAATEKAVIAFQTLFDLSPDGVVGTATWRALYAAYIRIITVEGAARSSQHVDYNAQLTVGSEGTTVVWVQRMLDFISLFFQAVLSPVAPQNVTSQAAPEEPGAYDPDGVYGPYTAAAVESFQREFSLPVTGTVDRTAWDALLTVFQLCSAEDIYGERPNADCSWPDAVLQVGAFGPLVTQLQQSLNCLGQYYCGLSFVREDGIFGADTLNVVRGAQREAQGPVLGSVTRDTWRAIQNALPAAARTGRASGGSGCPCACTGSQSAPDDPGSDTPDDPCPCRKVIR